MAPKVQCHEIAGRLVLRKPWGKEMETKIEERKTSSYLAQHGGDAFEVSKQTGLPLDKILDFSLNSNPYGPPNEVFAAIRSVTHEIKFYPSRSYTELREAIISYLRSFHGYKLALEKNGGELKLNRDNVVLGCGSTELIHSFFARFVRGRSVIIPLPTFSEYEAAASAHGIKCLKINPRGIAVDLDTVKATIEAGNAGCLVICNPNNPTGELFSTRTMLDLAEATSSKGVYMMVDEAYLDLSSASILESMIPAVEDFENLIVLRSLTKPFGFPGIRAGYAVASKKLARNFESTAISWRVGALESCAVLAAVGVKGFLEDSREKILTERPLLTKGLKKFDGLKVENSDANFAIVEISGTGFSPVNLKWRLLSHGVLIRELGGIQGLDGNYIRICIRSKRENANLLRALENVISSAPKINSMEVQNHCNFRPCHFEGQDCRICFCPFYPCLDDHTGGKFVKSVKGGMIWSCTDCLWIHRSGPAAKIITELDASNLNLLKSEPGEILKIRKKVLEDTA
jgi:histidinol-phosphate aminotransferase